MTDSPFDPLETRPPEVREAELFADPGARLAVAARDCRGLALHLEGHDPEAIDSREALAGLPLLTKNDLIEGRRARPPLGGFRGARGRPAAPRGPCRHRAPGGIGTRRRHRHPRPARP